MVGDCLEQRRVQIGEHIRGGRAFAHGKALPAGGVLAAPPIVLELAWEAILGGGSTIHSDPCRHVSPKRLGLILLSLLLQS